MSWSSSRRRKRSTKKRNFRLQRRPKRSVPNNSESLSSFSSLTYNTTGNTVVIPPPSTLIKGAFFNEEDEYKIKKNPSCQQGKRIIDNDFSIGFDATIKLRDRIGVHKGFEHCPSCNQLLKVIPSESRLICMNCAHSSEHIGAVSSNTRYGDDGASVVHVYLREKNFAAYLEQFHVDQPEVPYYILLQIKKAHRKRHVKTKLEIKTTQITKILKEIGLNRYIPQSSRIAAQLNGQAILQFTTHEIKEFLAMFRAILVPFLRIKGINRRNFLPASYLVSKFAGLRGWNHFQIPPNMLKSRNVLVTQDKIWAGICHEVGASYYPSA